ncbi:EamA family transporter [Jannaschia seohaensis]|uniref:EamA-like transporter family protein n=1 Tax=Jannaschia seohaensis TaxID=475081 RepID=A0A2Y9AV32_9RHOB|nr:EamA family transporter [Jannaschia seohaensis]PWJ16965.1 EamA-like transporter family protein [Jannaschia seohaensis]SSA48234.1 EamA-like transporter family protein [Jannaschia seohaensis]
MGVALALLAAAFYGLAGVAIQRGRATACGDNGVFLSVLATLGLSAGAWAVAGTARLSALDAAALWAFGLAGVASVILGRVTMFRATEALGPVTAGLLRRLTPIFAIPVAVVLLAEWPSPAALAGGGLILAGVALHLGAPGPLRGAGLLLGVASAGFYALAYGLRALGLGAVQDAALGTAVGALVGLVWFPLAAWRADRLGSLLVDRGPWHVTAALALAAGQLTHFAALAHAPVATVAMLGALDVLVAAIILRLISGAAPARPGRLIAATALAAIGTALILA